MNEIEAYLSIETRTREVKANEYFPATDAGFAAYLRVCSEIWSRLTTPLEDEIEIDGE